MAKITFPTTCNPMTLRLAGGNRKCDHDFTEIYKDDGRVYTWTCVLCGANAKVAKLGD